MQTVAVVFPNQLFAASPVLAEARAVLLLEHPHFFRAFRFHQKKLLFHRASMKAYADVLTQKGYEVHYVNQAELADPDNLGDLLASFRPQHLYVVDPCDTTLETELQTLAEQLPCELHVLESPQFMSPISGLTTFFKGRERLSMAQFYRAQRRQFGILMDDDKPVGGKWSFDAQNRRVLPGDVKVPRGPKPGTSSYVQEASDYVQQRFPDNPGSTDGFFYPVTTVEARRWLKRFLERRLAQFGPYEDAISSDWPFLFHSLLSPLLNAGLLAPTEVVVQTLKFSERRDVPLNSLEGFIRQVIGWREFVRAVYLLIGREQRTSNFWGSRNMLPTSFYTAETAMEPVDAVIRRVLDNAFAHHIERLMILGNFMLLCEIHPDEVYRWFMEMFIDGYDWVMVPNVYGMSQYADGGRITTKPYISSSNYVRKMSDFPRGAWCEVWDALFWRFVDRHRKAFAGIPRMNVMVRQLDRMDRATLKGHVKLAECYLATLFRH
jgi:deoxyribodipyrimidine photolyase-related protein